MLIRTHSSSLSDDELIVIDPMFDCYVPPGALLAKNYGLSFNTRFTHGLDDNELESCLGRLVQADILLVKEGTSGRPVYGLTTSGGELWQAERNPDWDRYCVASEGFGETDGTELRLCEVVAFSRDVGLAYMSLAKDCGLYPAFQPSDLKWQRATMSRDWTETRSPIYWMGSPLPWIAKLDLRLGDSTAKDYARFWAGLRSWSRFGDLMVRE